MNKEKAKPTPGPWRASVLGSHGTVNVDTDKRSVALTATLLDRAEDEANARLIAAAPDLYEACKVARSLLRKLGGKNHDPEFSELDAAIRKAEGEQP